MTVIYLFSELSLLAGSMRVIIEKANYLADYCGYNVYIITDSHRGRPIPFPLSVKVHHIDLGLNFDKQYGRSIPVRAYIYFKLMSRYKRELERLIGEISPDFVIGTFGREIDFLTNLRIKGKIIFEAHTVKDNLRNLSEMKSKGGIYCYIAKHWQKKIDKAAQKAAAVVVLAEREKSSWKSVRNVVVIPNSLPFYPELPLIKKENKKVIAVGRLSEEKGYDLLIQAWAIVVKKHSDWKLHLYGEGKLAPMLQEQIKALGIEESLYIEKPVSDIQNKYLESDFLILSSRYEGFGMVLIEAMACGIPCVSFECPFGPAEIITNDIDGILVPNANIQALADSTCWMIENTQKRILMGETGRKKVLSYTPEHIMTKWINLFEKLH